MQVLDGRERVRALGYALLAADKRWRAAGRLRKCLVRWLGCRQRVPHLRKRFVLIWFLGDPYLLSVNGEIE